MDAETDPSFLPIQLSPSDTDGFIDELYFGSEDTEEQLPQEPGVNELNESKSELYSCVQTMKTEMKDWRGMLTTQVKSYREEIGCLRDSLSSEVERLRNEFQKLKSTINHQLEKAKAKLTELKEPEETITTPEADESEPCFSNVLTE